MEFSHALCAPAVKAMIASWLKEDIPSFDVGGFVVGTKVSTAHLFMKGSGVIAGVPFFNEVFRQLGCRVEWKALEGNEFEASNSARIEVALVTGPVNALLQGERTALNILARASGIASVCRELRREADGAGWRGRVAGTRKTTPGFRMVEKYAMLVGGCDTHRIDLSSMVMLKDNHVHATGSITAAVNKARAACGFSVKIEVETSTLEAACEAADAGADVIMLDNLKPAQLHETAAALKSKYGQHRFLVEASGGITSATIKEYFGPNIDIISM